MSEEREPVVGYVLVLECLGSPARVYWNEWLVGEFDGRGQSLTTLVNPFVTEGVNSLRAEVAPGEPDEAAYLKVDLFKLDPSLPPEDKRTLYASTWRPQFGPWSRDRWTDVLRHELVLARAFGEWRWETARLFELRDEPAALAKVMELRSLLERRDAVGFVEACRIKLEELARATGRATDDTTLPQLEMLKVALSQPDLEIPSWKPEELELRSGAGGRLVRAVLKDGRAPLRLVVEDDPLELPVVLSLLDGRFEVVR